MPNHEACLQAALNAFQLERERQIEEEGFTPDGDKDYDDGELAAAAAAYALPPIKRKQGEPPAFWPWQRLWWKPAPINASKQDRLKEIVKAGALLLAEWERVTNERTVKKVDKLND